MKKEELEAKGKEIKDFIISKDVNFLCYIYDKEGKIGALNQSPSATKADAASCIWRIIKVFGLELPKLFEMLRHAQNAERVKEVKEIERLMNGEEGKKP